jgi:hypothetical protein
MEVIATGEKSGIKLEEYKGSYTLTAQHFNDGKYWETWAKYKKGKDSYMDKDWPVKVVLGEKVLAASALLMVLKEITGKDYAPIEF